MSGKESNGASSASADVKNEKDTSTKSKVGWADSSDRKGGDGKLENDDYMVSKRDERESSLLLPGGLEDLRPESRKNTTGMDTIEASGYGFDMNSSMVPTDD
uniref:Uncharacterized protein n=1 Tax=Trieres chinensis TaxID=1514140 RepID=A0A6U1SZ90_TRICV|mmetsp:Transcript_12263/g.25496  ORF Transcript_12263/g.25496 Transcript_12263/m.25496 type:complete len:102 (+) Transcript_12263:412-717(+)|eukprot:CAMPEP_0183300516 /NCGR_PEP_ID=MMETSP0160_2-20130417/6925_1 /TAXON_ID=2839 ORGANISM="Odontella Sinensis, Strain Grunow 1884" /NCGR_SAMPLE_ID=MMETSP0160_2 /ASSEMBLY_ACC=CAM_ASM_000250 /LENGTH=101 /DNA_ID=CAMNT_0025462955 /DNA_START=376 /DNA_END=681 /DNA_ORIENTATION=+